MTEEPKEETAIEPVTPKKQALTLFLETDMTPKQIARKAKVKLGDLEGWVQTEKWPEVRKNYIETLHERANQEYQRFIAEVRVKTLRNQMDTVEEMKDKMDKIIQQINPDEKTADVKLERMSRAFKNVSDIATKLAAITDKPFNADGTEAGNQPLFIMNIKPQLPASPPPPEKPAFIDVTPEEPS